MRLLRLASVVPWRWGSAEGLTASGVQPGRTGTHGRVAARAVTTQAGPEALFLWLCQLRRAPYSYDWIDNFGRRSPCVPDPSLTDLEVGQEIMTIFTLTEFEPSRSLTVSMRPGWPTRLFGAISLRYAIIPTSDGEVLLRGDLWMPPIGKVLGRLRRYLLAWGDLLMMRKQLRTLSTLAETTSTPPRAYVSRLEGGK